MKPEGNIAKTPEMTPVKAETGGSFKSPEQIQGKGIESVAERQEQVAELQSAVADATGMATVLPTPIGNTLDDVSNTTGTSSPIVANDDDLIEKEWVDKAKRIVEETKNDPYNRDDRVNKLRTDYIKKRFGRELGST